MALTLILALQAAGSPPAPAPTAAVPGWAIADPNALRGLADPDAAGPAGTADPGCRGAATSDVLVCGRRPRGGGDYPLERWARVFGPEAPIRAEMNLGGGVQGRVYTDAVPMDRGAVSNRVLVGVRTRF